MSRKHHLTWGIFVTVLALVLSAAAPGEAAIRSIGGFFKQVRDYHDTDSYQHERYTLCRQKFAGLGMNREIRDNYPWLAETIDKMQKEEWQKSKEIRQSMKAEAAEFRKTAPDRYHPFEHIYDVLMCRADTLAVSFIQKEYTAGDGAHGMYGWQGVTLSTATGSPIPLSAIVKDREAMTKSICRHLRSEYPEGLYGDMEKTVRELAEQDKLNWTLDPRGLTFYFNPYGLAPYAMGLLTTTILFAEEPTIFNESYTQKAPTYAQPFTADTNLVTDLQEKGQRDIISVHADKGIHVTVNGKETVFPEELMDLQPVLIHMEDGRNYLYIDGKEKETSVRKTLAVQLKPDKASQVATLPYSFRCTKAVSPAVQVYWNFLTNPNGFYFDQSSSFLRSSKTDICSINEKGTLAYG
jgi:hypothetical protein